ncbi:hypothetical protein [Yinghuangia sp. YIM S09857]|uniref:biotin synthase auxiliary protein BsaP n=1 Tax=Yinghuangia sp. YIM S09857 TaxID=3436929 RepID=UPI003F53C69E
MNTTVNASPGPAPASLYCDQCGEAASEAGHEACARRRELEPPRYCGSCRRRMVVQVTPRGWTAKCVEHGVLTA